jgi:hypothetical protein
MLEYESVQPSPTRAPIIQDHMNHEFSEGLYINPGYKQQLVMSWRGTV